MGQVRPLVTVPTIYNTDNHTMMLTHCWVIYVIKCNMVCIQCRHSSHHHAILSLKIIEIYCRKYIFVCEQIYNNYVTCFPVLNNCTRIQGQTGVYMHDEFCLHIYNIIKLTYLSNKFIKFHALKSNFSQCQSFMQLNYERK